MGRVAQKEHKRKRSASSCQRLDKLFTKLRRKDEGAGEPEGPGEARAEVIEIDSDSESEQQRESSNSAVTSSSTQSTGK